MNKPKYPVRGELVNQSKAAKILGLSSASLCKMRKGRNPKIPYRQMGATIMYDTADLSDYLDAVYVPTASQKARS